MLDIQKEKAFIQEVDKKTRNLELEKAKLEQSKGMVQDQLRQITEKMDTLGCTPDNIDSKIEESVKKIETLKAKMESILSPKTEDVGFQL